MTDPVFFFGGWRPLARIVVVGVAMYVALVVFLRASGSRTLADLNAFDFVVTVAIGSVFGRALTAKGLSLSEALAAAALLVVLQYAVTSVQVAWPPFGRAVTNPPVLLYFRDEYLRTPMRRERVTASELRAAVRKKPVGTLADVDAVVLESSGEFSVVQSVPSAAVPGDVFGDEVVDDDWPPTPE